VRRGERALGPVFPLRSVRTILARDRGLFPGKRDLSRTSPGPLVTGAGAGLLRSRCPEGISPLRLRVQEQQTKSFRLKWMVPGEGELFHRSIRTVETPVLDPRRRKLGQTASSKGAAFVRLGTRITGSCFDGPGWWFAVAFTNDSIVSPFRARMPSNCGRTSHAGSFADDTLVFYRVVVGFAQGGLAFGPAYVARLLSI